MKNLLLIPAVLLLLATMAYKAPASSLSDDFSVVEGSIIMPIQGEYMVDLDSSNGLNVGDILTVVKDGTRVVDATSKRVIGTRDIASGFLQVTRIQSGYSYTKALGSDFHPQKGEKVKRFKLVPTQLSEEVSKPLGTLLKAQLPQLDWDADEAMLTFSVKNRQLVILDAQKVALKSYQLNPNTGLVSGGSSVISSTMGNNEDQEGSSQGRVSRTLNNLLESFGIGSSAETPDTNSEEEQSDGYRGTINKTLDKMLEVVGVGSKQHDERLDIPEIEHAQPRNREVKAYIPIDEELVAITVADLNQDQLLETFVATKNRIGIFQIGQSGFRLTGSINIPGGSRILGLDSGDVNGDGQPELYINTLTGEKLSSSIVEFKGQQYTTTLADSDWFTRVIKLQGQTVLVGQKIGTPQAPFSGPLALLARQDKGLSVAEYIKLPQDATVFAFMPMPENPAQHYAYISKSNDLVVRDGQGNKTWQSQSQFGGSGISLFPAAEQQTAVAAQPLSLQPKIQQLASGEIVVAQNNADKTLAQLNGQSSKVTGLAWDDKKLAQKWHTDELRGLLIDIAVGDADNDGHSDLVTILQLPKEDPEGKDQSSIVIYQMN
jgi:hypothetical protein